MKMIVTLIVNTIMHIFILPVKNVYISDDGIMQNYGHQTETSLES